jgi:hypothetical protein
MADEKEKSPDKEYYDGIRQQMKQAEKQRTDKTTAAERLETEGEAARRIRERGEA